METQLHFLFVGLVIGGFAAGLIVWLVLKTKGLNAISEATNRYETQLSLMNERLAAKEQVISDRQKEVDKYSGQLEQVRADLSKEVGVRSSAQSEAGRVKGLEQKLENLSNENTTLKEEIANKEARLEEVEKSAQEKLELLKKAEENLTTTFKALSADALKESKKDFMQLATTTFDGYKNTAVTDVEAKKTAIDELLKPLKQTLDSMEKARENAYSSLTEQIKALAQGSSDLKGETSKLVQALKTPAVRGRWGEVQLKNVVQFTGMVKYCDFLEQQSVTSEEGSALRPDMIVSLPSKRSIIVDAKVPLQAFLEALEARDDDTHAEKMKAHASQVRQHIDNLSKKEYWDQFDDVPEFVFAFIPAESIYSAALQQDPSLIEYGASKNVILATPTSLITLLRVVAQGWREAQLAESAKEISLQGELIYDRIAKFVGHFVNLRKSIDKTVDGFNSAVSSLEARVLPAARKMKDLGVKTTSEIEVLETIDKTTRGFQSEELVAAQNTHITAASADPVEE